MIYNENESTGFYMIEIAVMTEFKDSNRNTRKECEICSKLTIKTPEQR